VSVSTVLPTSTTSASQSPAFLVGQIFVRQNATTCLSLRQEHSSTDGVSTLQPQLSGTRYYHISDHHPLVVDSLELGWKPSFHTGLRTSLRSLFWRMHCFTFTLHYKEHIIAVNQWTLNIKTVNISDIPSRRHLWSATRHHLTIPRYWLSTFGRRAFSVTGPMVWNSLPHSLRDPVLSSPATASDNRWKRTYFVVTTQHTQRSRDASWLCAI